MSNQLEKALITIRTSMLLKLFLVLLVVKSLGSIGLNIYIAEVMAANSGVDPDILFNFDPYFFLYGVAFLSAIGFSLYILYITSKERKYPLLVILLLPVTELALTAINIVDVSLEQAVTYAQLLLASLILLVSLAYKPVKPSNSDILETRTKLRINLNRAESDSSKGKIKSNPNQNEHGHTCREMSSRIERK